MATDLYFFFRGASGFALFFSGMLFLLSPPFERGRRYSGGIFLSVGVLFMLSALDGTLNLHQDASQCIMIFFLFILSQSLMELAVYIFADERRRGQRRTVWLIGAAWSLLLWALPLLDILLALPAVKTSVEDGRSLGPFHAFLAPLVYVWPVISILLSFRIANARVRDIARARGMIRLGIVIIAFCFVILGTAAFSELMHLPVLYRIAHALLQVSLLGLVLLESRYPMYVHTIRKNIGIELVKRKTLPGPREQEQIQESLEAMIHDPAVMGNERLNLNTVSNRIRIPVHRLSAYFNEILGESFPSWLNRHRIERVCVLMCERPASSILELAFECGYRSKATFNAQFSRIMGMSPTQWKKKV